MGFLELADLALQVLDAHAEIELPLPARRLDVRGSLLRRRDPLLGGIQELERLAPDLLVLGDHVLGGGVEPVRNYAKGPQSRLEVFRPHRPRPFFWLCAL